MGRIYKYTVPLAPVTKKNSPQIFYMGARCPVCHKGKTARVMPTRRRCDLPNHIEAIHDILVKANILADDNYTIIASVDGSRVMYDKENPRTEIFIEEMSDDEQPL